MELLGEQQQSFGCVTFAPKTHQGVSQKINTIFTNFYGT